SHLGHPEYPGANLYPNIPLPWQPYRPPSVWLPNATHIEMLHFLAFRYTFATLSASLSNRPGLPTLGTSSPGSQERGTSSSACDKLPKRSRCRSLRVLIRPSNAHVSRPY